MDHHERKMDYQELLITKYDMKSTIYKDYNLAKILLDPNNPCPKGLKNLPHREKAITATIPFLRNVDAGNRSNCIFFGPSGAGKTAVLHFLLNTLKSKGRMSNTLTIIVNCNSIESNTATKIFRCAIESLTGEYPESGRTANDYLRDFRSVCKKKRKNILFVLDELDKLEATALNNLLYNLTGLTHVFLQEGIDDVVVSILAVVNDLDLLKSRLNAPTKSRFQGEQINFSVYNEDQLYDILDDRIKPLQPGVVDEKVLRAICSHVAKFTRGDARFAIQTLRSAADHADQKEMSVLSVKMIKEIIQRLNVSVFDERFNDIDFLVKMVYLAAFYVFFLHPQDNRENAKKGVSGDKILKAYEKLHDLLLEGKMIPLQYVSKKESRKIPKRKERSVYNYLLNLVQNELLIKEKTFKPSPGFTKSLIQNILTNHRDVMALELLAFVNGDVVL